MAKRDKLLKRIQQNPKDVSFADLRGLLEQFGFELERTRGSHHSFLRLVGGKKTVIVLPYKRPLKEVYVKKALALIAEIVADQQGSYEAEDG